MVCEGCGFKYAARVRKWVDEATGNVITACDECGKVPSVWLPDAYLGGRGGTRTSEHLADPKTGKPIPYSSKREKAAVMRMLGVREAGDAKHGSKNANYRAKTRKHFKI